MAASQEPRSINSSPQRRSWLRVGIKTMLFAVTILAVFLSYHAHRLREQQRVLDALRERGFMLYYEESPTTVSGPSVWQRTQRFLGFGTTDKLVGVEGFHLAKIAPDELAVLRQLGTLRSFRIAFADIDAATFQAIGNLDTLEELTLSSPPFPVSHLEFLADLDQLKKLYITQPIGDEGIQHLCRLDSLSDVSMSSEGLSQTGIQQFAQLKGLSRLKLRGNLDVDSTTRQVLTGVSIDDGSWRRNRSILLEGLTGLELETPASTE